MLLTKDYAVYVRIPKLRIPRLKQILEKSKYRIAIHGEFPKRITRETPQELWAKIYIHSENRSIVIQFYDVDLNLESPRDKTVLVNIQDMDQLPSYLSIMGFPIDLSQFEKDRPEVVYADMPF